MMAGERVCDYWLLFDAHDIVLFVLAFKFYETHLR